MNKFEAIGTLKWSAKIGTTKFKSHYCFFTLVTTEKFTDKKGEMRVIHDSIPCSYFSKDSPPILLANTKIKVEGKIQTRKNKKTDVWETQANIDFLQILESDVEEVDSNGNRVSPIQFDDEIPF